MNQDTSHPEPNNPERSPFCSIGHCRKRVKSLTVRSGAYSAIGPVRKTNDDLVFANEDCRLFVVLDGIGGHDGGAEASRIVLKGLQTNIESMCTSPDADFPSALEKAINDALTSACESMRQLGNLNATLQKMGTVFALAFIIDETLLYTHVGDCRVYLVRKGRLQQLTRDETFVQLMLETGAIQPEDIDDHPMRSVIVNGVGPNSLERRPLLHSVKLQPDDAILLTSDGVTDFVQSEELARQLDANMSDPEQAAEAIVDAAFELSGTDNASCVVVSVGPPKKGNDELKAEVRRLRDSLEHIEDDLSQLTKDLHLALDEDDHPQVVALAEQFNDSVLRFEVRHPHLTGIVSSIANLLSGIGI